MRSTGNAFEQRARAELERAGLKQLASNYSTRHGELDLVMLEHHTVVFVEVRYRRHATHGDAAASVTPGKQAKLVKAAACWLASHPERANADCRFDVITYDGSPESPRSSWLRGAFEAT